MADEMINVTDEVTEDMVVNDYDDVTTTTSGNGANKALVGAGIGLAAAGAVYGIYRGYKVVRSKSLDKKIMKAIKFLEDQGFVVLEKADIVDEEPVEDHQESPEEEVSEVVKETPSRKKK